MEDLEEIIELLTKIDKFSNKYFGNKDYEIRYHTSCILNKFLKVR